MERFLTVLLLYMLFPSWIWGQQIEGTVKKNSDGKPVQFANVYLANTLVGTTTNSEGYFVLGDFAPGKYDLTVSFVGYETMSRSVEIRPNEEVHLAIDLMEEVVSLPVLHVLADTSDWAKNFKEFCTYFLGTSEASRRCKVLNKNALSFYFDAEDRVLYAHGREPLVIRNDWLGYKIIYDLASFKMDYDARKLAYYGVPRFENLETKNQKPKKRWIRHRKKVYKGSLLHFFRSLASNRLQKDRFEVVELYKVPYGNVPSTSNPQMTNEFRPWTTHDGSVKNQDSVLYQSSADVKPQYVDSLGRKFKDGDALIENDSVIYTGILKVVYKGAKEPARYPFRKGRRPGFQESLLYIYDALKLYDNGYYEDVRSTYLEGYWSWAGSLANVLPMDYVPANEQ